MGLFKLFGNKEKNTVISKGFYELRISEIQRLSKSAVKVSFEVPEQVKSIFSFLPGQYLTFELFLLIISRLANNIYETAYFTASLVSPFSSFLKSSNDYSFIQAI